MKTLYWTVLFFSPFFFFANTYPRNLDTDGAWGRAIRAGGKILLGATSPAVESSPLVGPSDESQNKSEDEAEEPTPDDVSITPDEACVTLSPAPSFAS